jgi:hypothetical protein
LEFELVAQKSGQAVRVLLWKPCLHESMQMWVCEVRVCSGRSHERRFFGATSFQALESAISMLPSLLLVLFPGEEFKEDGYPVFPTSLINKDGFGV